MAQSNKDLINSILSLPLDDMHATIKQLNQWYIELLGDEAVSRLCLERDVPVTEENPSGKEFYTPEGPARDTMNKMYEKFDELLGAMDEAAPLVNEWAAKFAEEYEGQETSLEDALEACKDLDDKE